MTPPGVEEQPRALPGAAVWNLAAPAVIRPHRDGWLDLHMRPLRDAEAAADALLAGHHGNGILIGLR